VIASHTVDDYCLRQQNQLRSATSLGRISPCAASNAVLYLKNSDNGPLFPDMLSPVYTIQTVGNAVVQWLKYKFGGQEL